MNPAVPTVRDLVFKVGLEKGLRQSTVLSYERLLGRLGILDDTVVSQEDVLSRLWGIDNPNTRRAAVIALRSIFGWKLKIPKGIPRRYDLPDEDTLRLALMTTPHEVRGLLMMYAGLRVGEACAVTLQSISDDQLTVDKQVIQLRRTGHPTVTRIGPVKTTEATVIVPHWLTGLVLTLDRLDKPDCVRESLRRAGHKVGISLTPHMLRHWFATTMLERGVPLPLVQRQMRHSDVAVTLRTYVQYRAEGTIHDTFG
jgi:integrase